jgi:hypothetical protein
MRYEHADVSPYACAGSQSSRDASHSSAADGAAAATSAAAAAQQAASASQVLELQQQMLSMAMKLQAREFQARRYKEAVRALKARHVYVCTCT